MRRISRTPVDGGVVPVTFEPATSQRRLFAPLPMFDDGVSGCWKCADLPCMSFSQEELAKPVPFMASMSPESRVCPTDALGVDEEGVPQIYEDTCIGCGMCVQRCPVGALYLDPEDAKARLADVSQGRSEPYASFQNHRATAAESLVSETAPFPDAELVNRQIRRMIPWPETSNIYRDFRILVRNTFLLSGAAARMGNQGDNSDWAEIVVATASDEGPIGAIQIEAEVSLDAHRRILSGLAVATSRFGASLSELVPMIVMISQPNRRTDYYRILSDIDKYLGVRLRTVPIAALLLGIREGRSDLLTKLSTGAYVDADQPSNGPWLEITYGAPSSSTIGVAPSK